MTSPIVAPMLSGTLREADLPNVTWPILASPKLDGIRCFVHPDLGPVTRSFKPIRNNYVRESLSAHFMHGLDGELVALDDMGRMDFNHTQSRIMTATGRPNFKFHVFDRVEDPSIPFHNRYQAMRHYLRQNRAFEYNIVPVDHLIIHTAEEFLEYFTKCLDEGYEGAMVRSMDGPYKCGRSTLKQGWLLKFKETSDAEGQIVGFEELLHNQNPDEKDAFGHAKRSSHQENLVPAGTLGALILETTWGELRVGTGFDAADRDRIWINRESLLGRFVTFKYQTVGMQHKPRFPVFKGFRYD